LKLVLLALFAPLLAPPAQSQGVRLPSPGVIPEGPALISELACLNCHAGGGLPLELVAPKRAPSLELVGARRTPASLRELLARPHQMRSGTSMPDMLARLSRATREELTEDLVHYLVSCGGPLDPTPFEATVEMLEEGRQLLHEIGCVACHVPEETIDGLFEPYRLDGASATPDAQPKDGERYVPPGTLEPPKVHFGDLARRTSVAALRDFLLDPLAVRPSGRMPSMKLSELEARDIAVYLLRDQFESAGHGEAPGMRYAYYEVTFPGGEVDLEGLQSVRGGILLEELSLPDHREDYFAFDFRGTLSVAIGGEYGFQLASDDGSWLFVDGEQVVDNGGIHPVVTSEGTLELAPGDHSLRILFYEHGGGSELSVSWNGPDFERRSLRGDDLVHRTISMAPPAEPSFELDAKRADRGRAIFTKLGCAACHEQAEARLPALEDCDLSAESGCLSESGGARYAWSEGQAASVRAFLEDTTGLAAPTPAEHVQTLLARNRCFACHRRDGVGGPHPERGDYFFALEDVDLGEEGRIPPSLDAVGSKLHPDWLGDVLSGHGTVRPYLLTRMPEFDPAELSELQVALLRVDSLEQPPTPPPFSSELMMAGRQLVGTDGLGCIQCHTFNGHRSLGIPAVDLATVERRIQYPWFRKLLRDPDSIGMNTRMPEFWIDGESPVKDVLEGDIDAQIDAIWTYLSLGSSMPMPAGLDVADSAYELEPGDAPRLVGVFMKGLSPRVVAVGTPELVHYAFDVENSRLAKIWRGRFFNARGTWEGRAGKLELPPSEDVLDLPEGPPFALLGDPQEEWPMITDRSPELRVLGRRYDEKRRPIFRYALGDIEIEEAPTTPVEADSAALVRRFRLRSPGPVENMFFNASDGRRVVFFEPHPGGGYRAEFEERISW
jgi:mono/diheme cytochrome c family protein/cytochrome c551/c552